MTNEKEIKKEIFNDFVNDKRNEIKRFAKCLGFNEDTDVIISYTNL